MTPVEQSRTLYAGCSGTWLEQAKWVIAHHSQEVIYQTNVMLYDALLKVNNDDSPEADAVRDELEIFWYALDEEHLKRLENHLAEKTP